MITSDHQCRTALGLPFLLCVCPTSFAVLIPPQGPPDLPFLNCLIRDNFSGTQLMFSPDYSDAQPVVANMDPRQCCIVTYTSSRICQSLFTSLHSLLLRLPLFH